MTGGAPSFDDVLAQPTRARLYALLGELGQPAGTDELAERLAMHPNGVRVHLERLHEAGLLTRERVRQPRGRPRDRWAVDPAAVPGGDSPRAYADLGRWLVAAISEAKVPVRQIEATGRRIGRELGRADGGGGADASPEERMHDALAGLGFQPERELGEDRRMRYCLGNCPYRHVVRERQPLVCALHRGMTRGLLDTLDPRTKLTGFVPKDPDEAGCLIELRGAMADELAARGT
jgi:predicted ArsR family transcriptional regulator